MKDPGSTGEGYVKRGDEEAEEERGRPGGEGRDVDIWKNTRGEGGGLDGN